MPFTPLEAAIERIRAVGVLFTAEVNTLTELGIPAKSWLCSELGVDEKRLHELIATRQVGAGVALPILERNLAT